MFKLFLACHRFRGVSQFRKHYWFKYIRPKSNPQLAISNLTKKDFNCHFISLWRKATALITLDHLPGYVHNDPVLKLSETSVFLLSMKHQRFAAWQKRSTLHCLRRNEPVNCQIINEITDRSRFFLVFVFTIRSAACRVKGFWYLSALKEIKYNGLLLNMHVAIDCSLS